MGIKPGYFPSGVRYSNRRVYIERFEFLKIRFITVLYSQLACSTHEIKPRRQTQHKLSLCVLKNNVPTIDAQEKWLPCRYKR